MKKLLSIYIIFLSITPLLSKDFKDREKILNSILNEPVENKINDKKPDDAQKNKEIKIPGKEKKGDIKKEKDSPAMSTPDEAVLKTGIQFFNSGLYPSAVSKLKELNDKYPQSPYKDNSKIWMGRAYLKLYKYDDAINELSSIPADSGEYPTALYFIAEGYLLKGDLVASIENYERLSAQFPEHELADNAILNIGKLYLDMKNGEQALTYALRLIKYYKSRETIDDAFYLLGKIFEKDPTLKDFQLARKVYRLFIKKASAGDILFQKSPLLKRVQYDLNYIEKTYFKLEN